MEASPPKPYFSRDVSSRLVVRGGSRILHKPQLNRRDDLRMKVADTCYGREGRNSIKRQQTGTCQISCPHPEGTALDRE